MSIEDLKSKYDGKQIDEIESIATATQNSANTARREFVEILFYLRHTKRYRENPQYSKATFGAYIRGVYMMSETTFEQERKMYICFASETKKFGPGVVSKAVKRLGATKAVKVLKRLPQNTRIERINTVIESEAPKKKPAPAADIRTRDQLLSEIESLKADVRERDRIIAERDEQIAKLKASLMVYKEIATASAIVPAEPKARFVDYCQA